jgi:hypothetical protein
VALDDAHCHLPVLPEEDVGQLGGERLCVPRRAEGGDDAARREVNQSLGVMPAVRALGGPVVVGEGWRDPAPHRDLAAIH